MNRMWWKNLVKRNVHVARKRRSHRLWLEQLEVRCQPSVSGYSPIVQDPTDNESKIGFGQHGGLGVNEQRPFLLVDGGGFAPGERRIVTSLTDIAPTVLRHLHMDHDDTDGRALPREPG